MQCIAAVYKINAIQALVQEKQLRHNKCLLSVNAKKYWSTQLVLHVYHPCLESCNADDST